jgi:hypothetical protein
MQLFAVLYYIPINGGKSQPFQASFPIEVEDIPWINALRGYTHEYTGGTMEINSCQFTSKPLESTPSNVMYADLEIGLVELLPLASPVQKC